MARKYQQKKIDILFNWPPGTQSKARGKRKNIPSRSGGKTATRRRGSKYTGRKYTGGGF